MHAYVAFFVPYIAIAAHLRFDNNSDFTSAKNIYTTATQHQETELKHTIQLLYTPILIIISVQVT